MYNITIPRDLNVPYTIVEIVCAVIAIFANFLVILVFYKYRRLRKTMNYYIISLATADLMVGLIGIPSALATSVGLPRNFHLCIFMNSILLLLCTGSILSLVAITVDRYWAIIYPLSYTCHVTERRVLWAIIAFWVIASMLGLLPTVGWNHGPPPEPRCFFMEVMDLRYLAFLFIVTMIAPSIFMAVVYAIIYGVVRKQITQMSDQIHASSRSLGSSEKLSTLHQQKHSETKVARNFAIIILIFIISWFPLYIIKTVICFCLSCGKVIPGWVMEFCIILSHLNSVWNPALYAWGLSDFREALVALLMSAKDTLPFRKSERFGTSTYPLNGVDKSHKTMSAVKVNFIIDADD